MDTNEKLERLSININHLGESVTEMVEDGMDEAGPLFDEFVDSLLAIAFGMEE